MLRTVFPVNILHQRATRRGLLYLVIGGHAINVYCEPRATLDVDFMVRKEDKSAWVEILEEEGFQLHHDGETFLQFLPPYGVEWRLDLMMVSSVTFDKMAAAAQTIELLGVPAKIPTPTHLISLKLHALKHGHPERFDKDFGDVVALTRTAGLDPRTAAYRELVDRFGSTEIYDKNSNDSPHPKPDMLQDKAVDLDFDLPVEPGYRERPPKGDWEAGYRLSLEALKLVKNRPEIFEQRDRTMCREQFVL